MNSNEGSLTPIRLHQMRVLGDIIQFYAFMGNAVYSEAACSQNEMLRIERMMVARPSLKSCLASRMARRPCLGEYLGAMGLSDHCLPCVTLSTTNLITFYVSNPHYHGDFNSDSILEMREVCTAKTSPPQRSLPPCDTHSPAIDSLNNEGSGWSYPPLIPFNCQICIEARIHEFQSNHFSTKIQNKKNYLISKIFLKCFN
jgi:hypothetical protein